MNDPVERLLRINEKWRAPDTYYLGIGESNPLE
jgi:hypothetical protein